MKKSIISVVLLAAGCGGKGTETTSVPESPTCDSVCQEDQRYQDLKDQILALQGTVSQISNFANSEYDTCTATGDTSDALIRRICQVAQSADATARVEMKGELATYAIQLSAQLQTAQTALTAASAQESSDISSVNAQIASITTQISSINTSLTTLQSQMTSANSAITALQAQVASINATLNGLLQTIDIGSENKNAGPLYETVERRVDKTKIVAYVDAGGTNRGLGTLWATADGASTAVLQTTLGSQKYNFIVKADGSICYDKTTSNQTFAIISAFGTNIICK